MSIFIVYNGWQGNGSVACIVSADDFEEAISQAKIIFAEDAESMKRPYHKDTYILDYSTHLKAEKITLPYLCEID